MLIPVVVPESSLCHRKEPINLSLILSLAIELWMCWGWIVFIISVVENLVRILKNRLSLSCRTFFFLLPREPVECLSSKPAAVVKPETQGARS